MNVEIHHGSSCPDLTGRTKSYMLLGTSDGHPVSPGHFITIAWDGDGWPQSRPLSLPDMQSELQSRHTASAFLYDRTRQLVSANSVSLRELLRVPHQDFESFIGLARSSGCACSIHLAEAIILAVPAWRTATHSGLLPNGEWDLSRVQFTEFQHGLDTSPVPCSLIFSPLYER